MTFQELYNLRSGDLVKIEEDIVLVLKCHQEEKLFWSVLYKNKKAILKEEGPYTLLRFYDEFCVITKRFWLNELKKLN